MYYFINTISKRNPATQYMWTVTNERNTLDYVVKELELDLIVEGDLFSPDDYMNFHGLSRMTNRDWLDYNYTIEMWRADYVYSRVYEVDEDYIDLSLDCEEIIERWGRELSAF